MSDDDQLERLLDLWQQARTDGVVTSPEELCRGRPDLVRELRLRIFLLLWEEGVEVGQPPTPESLCRDWPALVPELKRRVDTLRRMNGWIEPPATLEDRVATTRTLANGTAPLALPCVPGFEFREQLGGGGQGWVYLALQVQLNRIVAVKIPRDRLLGSEQVARFQEEAWLLARLNHPHIVQVYQSELTDAGQPCLVMEFVSGSSLARRLESGPLPGDVAARLVEKIARAIHFSHSNGIVHCDLKPSNILLTRDGEPKVADFGLARLLQEQLSSSHTLIKGTPSYMAPEQVTGKRKKIGPRTDVYALGAILYESLSGRPPFLGATILETFDQIRNEEPIPLRRLQPGLASELQMICAKCLHKEPALRYANAEALADDLRRYLNREPIEARNPGFLSLAWLWSRRPERVRDAGVMMLFFGVMALVWFAIVIAGLVRGDYPTPDPLSAWRTSLYSVGGAGVCVVLGWATLQRWVGALWLAVVASLHSLAKSVAGFIGYRQFLWQATVPDAQQPHAEARFLALTTALVISALLFSAYVVALIAWYANRDAGRSVKSAAALGEDVRPVENE